MRNLPVGFGLPTRDSRHNDRHIKIPSNPASFNGNFSSLFTGVLQSVQTDLGITYGGTLLATGTTPPVLTFTGALTGTPVPITVTVTLGGARGTWTGSISYDGGATQAQTFTSAATVPLTGAGAGLTLAIAVGNANVDNVFKATCSAWADQSGAGKNYSIVAAGSQPIITVGLSGKPGLKFDGVDDELDSLLSLGLPSVTPYYEFLVFRQITWTGGNNAVIGSQAFSEATITTHTASPTIASGIQGTTFVDNSAAVLNSWVIVENKRSNNAADTFKVGATTATGNAGDAVVTNRIIASWGIAYTNIEVLAYAVFTGTPNWPAVRAAVTAFYGASVAV